jgi:hypothetical protein
MSALMHEPTDPSHVDPLPVSRELFDRLCMVLGAVREGPAGDEVVHLNGRVYRVRSAGGAS